MRRNRQGVAAVILLLLGSAQAHAAAGFATRDLNPVLQSLYLPTLVPIGDDDGWRLDHSLYITNTLHDEGKGDEELVIDVENYRYEFALRHRRGNWVGQFALPLVANDAGELDGLIDDWHDFFGLPEGKRDEFEPDQLDMEYRRDGAVEFSQTESTDGLGDISLAIGYQRPGETGYFFGIELPTGSASDFSGNEAVDYALWVTRELEVDADSNLFGMFGVSFPGDDGRLEGLLVDRIWAAQVGMDLRFYDDLMIATVQLDMHSRTVDGSRLDAFGNSLQIQLGLGFPNLPNGHRLDLFFSEDIAVGTAPDISFSLRLARDF